MPLPVPPEPYLFVQSLTSDAIQPIATTVSLPATAVDNRSSLPPAPLNTAKSAKLLGAPVSISYPAPPLKAQDDQGQEEVGDKAESKSDATLPAISVSSPAATRSLSAAFSDSNISPTAPQQATSPQALAFHFRFRAVEPRPTTLSILAQAQTPPVVTPQPPSQIPGQTPVGQRVIELTSQRQEYDAQRQIVTAEGNVVLRINGAVVSANRLQVNLQNLIGVGEGNVVVTRGQQVLRGQRFTYNFVQDSGEVLYARGDVYLPTTSTDFAGTLPTDLSTGGALQQQAQLQALNQPLQQVTSPGGINIAVGGGRYYTNLPRPKRGGNLRRLRFQAEQINFYPGGWQATNVRLTNDPFSPPELEVRANTATLTQQTPLQSRLVTTNPRLVFDQNTTIPIPKRDATIGRRQRSVNAFPIQAGYDATDKGGLYIEHSFTVVNNEQFGFSLTPQFLAQRAANGSGDVADYFGLGANLAGSFGPRTSISGVAIFNGLDLSKIDRRLRASLRLRQVIGSNSFPYVLSLESSYRNRLYNGSLGYQTVQSSIGAILTSPVIPLGKTGITLSYQVGIQDIDADTDRPALLSPIRTNNRVTLGRFQGTAALSRAFPLWTGKGLPATPDQGLKYTPTPVVPNLVAFGSLQGVGTYYTSGDRQNSLTATVGLQGQLGHFSKPFLDYSSFNLSYSQGLVDGSSPFLFDRYIDTKVLGAGITQQIYGPFRLGVQTALNLDTGQDISTDIFIDYSRRTYGIVLRYNPVLGLGSISLRISDFNWLGGTNAFSGSDIQPVVNGVVRENY